jgi:hypothetical protein
MTRGSTTRRALALSAVAVAAVFAASGSADASLSGCRSNAPKPNKEVGLTSRAIVFRSHGLLYGCAYSDSQTHKLPGQTGSLTIDRGNLVLAEGFVAYPVIRAGHDRTEWIYSVNIRTNKRRHRSAPHDNISVGSVVLKDNGSVAWMYSWHPGTSNGYTRVAKIDGVTGDDKAKQDIDSDETHPDNPNVLGSLRITRGGTRLSWAMADGRIAEDEEPAFE